MTCRARRTLERRGRITAFPQFWQLPAATEMAAYDALLAERHGLDFDYIGFPWATLIDGLRADAAILEPVLKGWQAVAGMRGTRRGRVATVAQHIHAGRLIRLVAACGVTDMFWSHATRDRPVIGGVRIHPFPLYPTQAADSAAPVDPDAPRPYLANFVGAHLPDVYLSDTRARIFEDAGRDPDLLIVRRDAWHFQRHVYEEQLHDREAAAAQLRDEAARRREYLDALGHASFTLCPTGSGPNSIRIGEALALGSIPIVLSTDLALPGDPALWDAACLIDEDSVAGYRRAMARARAMSGARIREKRRAGRALYARIAPGAFGRLIVAGMAQG